MLLSRKAALLVVLTVLVGCTTAAPTRSSQPATGQVGSSAGPKHITLAVVRAPDLRPIAAGPALVAMPLVHSGLTARGDGRVRRARLAEAVPSLENGLWTLFP